MDPTVKAYEASVATTHVEVREFCAFATEQYGSIADALAELQGGDSDTTVGREAFKRHAEHLGFAGDAGSAFDAIQPGNNVMRLSQLRLQLEECAGSSVPWNAWPPSRMQAEGQLRRQPSCASNVSFTRTEGRKRTKGRSSPGSPDGPSTTTSPAASPGRIQRVVSRSRGRSTGRSPSKLSSAGGVFTKRNDEPNSGMEKPPESSKQSPSGDEYASSKETVHVASKRTVSGGSIAKAAGEYESERGRQPAKGEEVQQQAPAETEAQGKTDLNYTNPKNRSSSEAPKKRKSSKEKLGTPTLRTTEGAPAPAQDQSDVAAGTFEIRRALSQPRSTKISVTSMMNSPGLWPVVHGTSQVDQHGLKLVPAPVADTVDADGNLLIDTTAFVMLRPLPYERGDDPGQRTFVYKGELIDVPMLPLFKLDKSSSANKDPRVGGHGWQKVKSKVMGGGLAGTQNQN